MVSHPQEDSCIYCNDLNFLGVRVDKVKRELENVLNEKQVLLHNSFTVTPETLGEIARELSAVNIINKAVKKAPTYDAIIDSFVNGMKLKKEISGVEEYCKKFLKALSNIGGPVDDAASMITDEWTKAVKEKCGVDLTLGWQASEINHYYYLHCYHIAVICFHL